MQQNYQLIPCYYNDNGLPAMVFDNSKATPTLFMQNNSSDIAFAQKLIVAESKLNPMHRPLVFIDTLLHTSDPGQAIKSLPKLNLNATAMILAGDPYLYPTQTPSMVYWDSNKNSFKTVTDKTQMLKLLPSILSLSQGSGRS